MDRDPCPFNTARPRGRRPRCVGPGSRSGRPDPTRLRPSRAPRDFRSPPCRASRRTPPPDGCRCPSTRSITNTCPSRFSCSKTPWWAKHSIPVTDELVAEVPRARGVSTGSSGHQPSSQRANVRRASRLARTSCTRSAPDPLLRPGARSARSWRSRGRRPGAGVAVGAGEQRAEERLAAGPDQHPEARAPAAPGSRSSSCQLCAARLGEAQARVEHDPLVGHAGRAEPRRPRCASSSRTAASTPPGPSYDGVVGHPVAVRAPVHADVRRARSPRPRRGSAGRPARPRRR